MLLRVECSPSGREVESRGMDTTNNNRNDNHLTVSFYQRRIAALKKQKAQLQRLNRLKAEMDRLSREIVHLKDARHWNG